MHVLLDSMRVMIMEARGRKVLYAGAALCGIHAAGFLLPNLLRNGLQGSAVVIAVSLAVYGALLVAAWGPLAETVTVTIDGVKHRVVVEYLFPMDKKKIVDIPFDAFTQFELSPPLDYGFFRLRMKSGKAFHLLHLGATDDYQPLQHLDMITRKQLVMVVRKPKGATEE